MQDTKRTAKYQEFIEKYKYLIFSQAKRCYTEKGRGTLSVGVRKGELGGPPSFFQYRILASPKGQLTRALSRRPPIRFLLEWSFAL